MDCPVCDSSDRKTVLVTLPRERELTMLLGEASARQRMARCNECGVLYDHLLDEDESGVVERSNCAECGSPNPTEEASCSTCGASLIQ